MPPPDEASRGQLLRVMASDAWDTAQMQQDFDVLGFAAPLLLDGVPPAHGGRRTALSPEPEK